jgi:tetratricopeptide (TPR) repeat protein
MPTDFSQKINKIFADAYHAAALQEAEMQALAAVLEPMRSRLKANSDTLAVRAALDTAIGGNKDENAEKPLLRLREEFVVLQKEIWLAELENTLRESPAEAWKFFLTRYAECLSVWRTQLACWWADAALGEAPENTKSWFPEKKDELRRFQTSSRLMEQRRWPEAYPFLRDLGENSLLPPKLRAQCWTICSSIQIYFNTIPDARNDLAKAEELFPELHFLQLTRADLERMNGNYKLSKEISQALISKNPNDTEALNGLARTFSEEKNFAEAAHLLAAAIAADPGNSANYRDKIALWAKDEVLFKENGSKIPEIVRLATLADPESELSNLLEAGYAYQSGGDLDLAKKWFEKALKAEPERVETIVAIGGLHQAKKEYDKAAEYFSKVLVLAPACVDGYWSMAGLCNAQEKYVEAAAWYEKALPHCPMFTRTLWVKAGEAYVAAGDFEKGKNACLEALNIDPDFDFALNTLHDLSDKLREKAYNEKTSMEPALEVLRQIRAIKGDTYEPSFQNRVGNVYYYFADYQNAAAHYRNAIAADASVAVYHDNLSGASEKLAEREYSIASFEEAIQAIQAASRLEPSNENYRKQASRLEQKLQSLRHFGMPPEERSADIAQIRVRFRDELYPWLVKDDNLAPDLLQKIENLRDRFKKAFGVTIPGVRFSADWNIVAGVNYVIDLDGIPMQQELFRYENEEAVSKSLDWLVSLLEWNIQAHLADFIHYDSPEISAKFVGKPAAYAAAFFQVVRMLLKQKISIADINAIHRIFDENFHARKPVQAIAEAVRCHSAMLPALPVNALAARKLRGFPADLEEHILSNTRRSSSGQMLWQMDATHPAFFRILDYIPTTGFELGDNEHFVVTEKPAVATLLSDLQAGTFFSRGEVLNLKEAEII